MTSGADDLPLDDELTFADEDPVTEEATPALWNHFHSSPLKGIHRKLRGQAIERGEKRVAVCVFALNAFGRLLCRRACIKYSVHSIPCCVIFWIFLYLRYCFRK